MGSGQREKEESTPQNLEGHFLISEVDLADPHFHKTVVLIINHDKDGALGIVVNRRLEISLGDVHPDFENTEAGKLPIYQGGPVQQEYLFSIYSGLPSEIKSENASAPLEQVTFEPAFGVLAEYLRNTWSKIETHNRPPVNLYVGYSGWGPGQLEMELTQGTWITRPAAAKLIFAVNPDEGWREALGELGGMYKIIAETG